MVGPLTEKIIGDSQISLGLKILPYLIIMYSILKLLGPEVLLMIIEIFPLRRPKETIP